MKIYVSRVPAEGLRDRATYEPAALDMDAFDVHLREPFEVDAFVTKADEELVVTAGIRASLWFSCARCLEEFSSLMTTTAVFSYTVRPSDIVDITDDVRQEVMLAYPMIPVCRPDCKGLCPACGQNLNVAACPHRGAADDSS